MKSCKGERKRWLPYALPLLIAAAVGFTTSVATASHTVTMTEDIRNTKHYMVGNPDVLVEGTTEVCVFCHTPHGSNPLLQGLAPLWNRIVAPKTGFDLYNSPNFDKSGDATCTSGGCAPKGVSLACLSCHDGTFAVDALINAPGSGGFRSANRQDFGVTPAPGVPVGFTYLGDIIDGNSSLKEGERSATTENTTGANYCPSGGPCSAASPYAGGIHDTVATGGGGAEPFPNLGKNLSDDHPIGMEVPWPGFNSQGGKEDPQFSLIGLNSTLETGADGVNVKFITKNGLIAEDKRDRLRAYPSTDTQGSYYIECASCHNPHTPRVSFLRLPGGLSEMGAGGIVNPTDPIPDTWSPIDGVTGEGLLWAEKPNSGSAVCLSCHQK